MGVTTGQCTLLLVEETLMGVRMAINGVGVAIRWRLSAREIWSSSNEQYRRALVRLARKSRIGRLVWGSPSIVNTAEGDKVCFVLCEGMFR